jgi:hypothetical protein
MAKAEMNKIIHHQGVECPYCKKDIVLLLDRVQAVTLEEFRDMTTRQVAEWRRKGEI